MADKQKNKNNHVIIAYYPGADKADMAANQIKAWDDASEEIKLGSIGILTWEDGKINTRKVGQRATSSGAKWGTALGVTAAILSGGVTLLGGAVAGMAGGALLGSMKHKSLGLTDEDNARLEEHLKGGGAALVVMADEHEVGATSQELTGLGGTVENFQVPEEAMEQIDAVAAESAEEAEDGDDAAEGDDESA